MKGIITLCGSTKFKEAYETVNRELTLRGWIVLSVGCYWRSMHQDWLYDRVETFKINLDKLHKEKIKMSHAIVVLDEDSGYTGQSTNSEIAYAKENNIPVIYASSLPKDWTLIDWDSSIEKVVDRRLFNQ